MSRTTAVLLCAVLLAGTTGAIAEPLASWEDPAGDDTGDGDYTYPTNAAFGELGEADLLEFAIEKARTSSIPVASATG